MRRFVFFFLDEAPGRPSPDAAAMATLQHGYLVMVPLRWFAADGVLLRK